MFLTLATKKKSGEFAEIWEVKQSTENVKAEAGYWLTGRGVSRSLSEEECRAESC